ncbi:hypothetical protein niasHT_024021 [Heterodera trifolii]|uniref:Effector protein n=1 Tax=Heterodera trifolii TaxID=157864 RepID=A0ABD2KPE3_9BILA
MAKFVILVFLFASLIFAQFFHQSSALFRECSSACDKKGLKCVRECQICVKSACKSTCGDNLSEPKCTECYDKSHDCAPK